MILLGKSTRGNEIVAESKRDVRGSKVKTWEVCADLRGQQILEIVFLSPNMIGYIFVNRTTTTNHRSGHKNRIENNYVSDSISCSYLKR